MKRFFCTFAIFGLAAFFLLSASSFATAAEPIHATKEPTVVYHPFYVGVFGGYITHDELKMDNGGATSTLHLNNSWTAGAKAGYIFPFRWVAAELEYAYLDSQRVEDPQTGSFKANNVMANLLLRYPEGMIRPYIGAGAGWSWGKFSDVGPTLNDSANALGWQALAGINLEITPYLSTDFGYRYFSSKYGVNDTDATVTNHILTLGFNYHFGGKKPVEQAQARVEPAAAATVVQEKDSDGDGIVDRLDRCPDSPRGCPVDENGCPLDSDKDGVIDCRDKCPNTLPGCVVDKDGCPVDSDQDGVCDGRDKCADSPRDCPVDENGCPLDSDKDGVIDCRDKCPDTPEIAKVDEKGCPYMAVIRLTVQFDYKKAIVKPEFYDNIKKLGDFMKNHPKLTATIEGHTDNIASAKYNLELSRRRAEAVRNILIQRENIDPKRLSIVGYGFSKPIASNDTDEGRALNRRVQAFLEAQEIKK